LAISLPGNIVYAAMDKPMLIMMLNGNDGSIIHKKIFKLNGAYYSPSGDIIKIGYAPNNYAVVMYISDASNDFIIFLNSNDLAMVS
jgi:hypothetical protein